MIRETCDLGKIVIVAFLVSSVFGQRAGGNSHAVIMMLHVACGLPILQQDPGALADQVGKVGMTLQALRPVQPQSYLFSLLSFLFCLLSSLLFLSSFFSLLLFLIFFFSCFVILSYFVFFNLLLTHFLQPFLSFFFFFFSSSFFSLCLSLSLVAESLLPVAALTGSPTCPLACVHGAASSAPSHHKCNVIFWASADEGPLLWGYRNSCVHDRGGVSHPISSC